MSTFWSSPRILQKVIAFLLPTKDTWQLECRRHWDGPWVFDVAPFFWDEPLVFGTELVVDHYFQELTGTAPVEGDQVLLTVSRKPIEGQTTELTFERPDAGGYRGNTYIDSGTGNECWLCGVNQVLFGEVPQTIHVKVQPQKQTGK